MTTEQSKRCVFVSFSMFWNGAKDVVGLPACEVRLTTFEGLLLSSICVLLGVVSIRLRDQMASE